MINKNNVKIANSGYPFKEFHKDIGIHISKKNLEYVCWASMTDMFTLAEGVENVLEYIKANVPDESGIVDACVVWEIERILKEATGKLTCDELINIK